VSWLDGLEDDFGYRLPSPEGYNVALAVHNAIHSSIPDSGRAPHLVYPIDWADDRTGALWIDDQGVHLVLVDPPDAAVVRFLGSLDGGEYREALSPGEGTRPGIEGFFNHERLGGDGPLRLLVHPVPGNPYLTRPSTKNKAELDAE
jgi:hypothetical protein